MPDFPVPPNEDERLQALHRYEILDTPPEEAFDRLTRLAGQLLDTPIALVSLVDEARQWFKSAQGLERHEAPREWAFCAYTILDNQSIVVADATADARFMHNPLVREEPHIRFYAGAPLIDSDGFALGSLCVIDRKPRQGFAHADLQLLTDLAGIAVDELELRRVGRQLLQEVAQRTAVELRLQQALAEIAQKDSAKTAFLNEVAHELRDPLTAVMGYAELIEATPPGPAGRSQFADYARTLAEASRHMLSLVNDLLDQAKIEAGRIDLAEDEVAVAEATDAACRVIAPHSRTLAVELVDGTEVDGTKLRADRRRLRQMLINLLSNAVKFTPAGGRVTVTSEATPDGALLLKVVDNGIGIEAADIGRILIPFERAARHGPGTGLGLPITKQLIELHGGSLSISSEVGGGTTATLRFPPDRVVLHGPQA